MIARLGDVLYWAGCGLAALTIMAASIDLLKGEVIMAPVYFWIAVGFWLIGLACRYVLAGPKSQRLQ